MTWMSAVVGLALVLWLPMRAEGQHLHALDFDEPSASWQIRHPQGQSQSATRIEQHRREAGGFTSDGRMEVLRFRTGGRNQRLHLTHKLPPARSFDELTLKLRVRSSQGGLQLGARLVFADHRDPRNGKPLTAIVRGEIYRKPGEWTQLTCRFNRETTQNALSELRGMTSLDLARAGHTYVDQAVVLCDFNPGPAVVAIDDLEFGPVVTPARYVGETGGASPDDSNGEEIDTPRTDLRLGQLRVQGKPFFPRIMAWHRRRGESIDALKYAGINTVLIPDATDADAIRKLKAAGMLVIAAPPRFPASSRVRAVSTASRDVVRLPDGPAMWYLGTRIPASKQGELRAWAADLKRVDSRQRLIMADVTGAERVYSRHLDMLGLSKPVLGTSLTLRDYRDSLLHVRANAQPDSFTWTWVQAEVPSAFSKRRLPDSDYVVEPEQIRLQTWTAIASGSKAIGYWKTSSLDGSRPGDRERRLMLHQLGMELGLVEDWLATSELRDRVHCEAGVSRKPHHRRSQVARDWQANQARRTASRSGSGRTNIEAAVLTCQQGTLVLPIWYSATAQYAPSEMVAENISFLVHVAEDERDAWLLTTTGIRPLETGVEAGGLRVHISTSDRQVLFDQTAMILIAPRPGVVQDLQARIRSIAAESAKTLIDLAEAKRDRIRVVEDQFVATDDRTRQTMNNVQASIDAARQSIAVGSFDAARRQAQRAMQLLRRLQHVRWLSGTQMLASPSSSPFAGSYNDLPNQIRLMEHIEAHEPTRAAALMPVVTSGEVATLQASNWRHLISDSSILQSRAGFVKGSGPRYELEMAAIPASQKLVPDIVSMPPVRATAAPLQLEPGELVRVRGKIQLPGPVVGNVNGAMIFDNLLGPSGAVRWRQKTQGWQEFELIRETTKATEFYLTFVLSGIGRVRIADVELHVYPARNPLPRLSRTGD